MSTLEELERKTEVAKVVYDNAMDAAADANAAYAAYAANAAYAAADAAYDAAKDAWIAYDKEI